LLLALALVGAGFAIDQFELGSRAKWAVVLPVAMAVAVGVQWRRWRQSWFLPALGVAIAANVAISLFADWPFAEGRMTGELIPVLVLSVAAETLWLFWIGWLFEPRDAPRTSQQMMAAVVLHGFAIVMIGFVGFILWAANHAEAEHWRLAQIVMSEKSDLSAQHLRFCLEPPRSVWSALPGSPGGKRLYDPSRGHGINVIDQGGGRLVQITTRQGRPLRKDEIASIAKCLAPGAE
jgi:hypothetical protein